MAREDAYCDNCGAQGATCPVSELPVAVDSANAGESAILCRSCYDEVMPPIEDELSVKQGEGPRELTTEDAYAVLDVLHKAGAPDDLRAAVFEDYAKRCLVEG